MPGGHPIARAAALTDGLPRMRAPPGIREVPADDLDAHRHPGVQPAPDMAGFGQRERRREDAARSYARRERTRAGSSWSVGYAVTGVVGVAGGSKPVEEPARDNRRARRARPLAVHLGEGPRLSEHHLADRCRPRGARRPSGEAPRARAPRRWRSSPRIAQVEGDGLDVSTPHVHEARVGRGHAEASTSPTPEPKSDVPAQPMPAVTGRLEESRRCRAQGAVRRQVRRSRRGRAPHVRVMGPPRRTSRRPRTREALHPGRPGASPRAEGRLQPHDPTEACRCSDRASGVGAEGDGSESPRVPLPQPPTRAARSSCRIPADSWTRLRAGSGFPGRSPTRARPSSEWGVRASGPQPLDHEISSVSGTKSRSATDPAAADDPLTNSTSFTLTDTQQPDGRASREPRLGCARRRHRPCRRRPRRRGGCDPTRRIAPGHRARRRPADTRADDMRHPAPDGEEARVGHSGRPGLRRWPLDRILDRGASRRAGARCPVGPRGYPPS